MSDFYQQYLTDKSFSLLIKLKKRYQFVLIGGWAVYFYTHGLKSKDIDIIIDFSELTKLKKDFFLEKNDRLKKYQVKVEEIDLDIYLPYYSDLGLPVEKMIKKTTVIKGFSLLTREMLLISKIKAYLNRQSSIKGQKDLIDIISLLISPDFDFANFKKILEKEDLDDYKNKLIKIVSDVKEISELRLNKHQFSKKKKEILAKLT